MKTTKTSRLARIFVTAMAVCMLVCLMAPMAMAANDAVNDCRYGVLQVKLNYTGDNNETIVVNGGTGFLINDNTLVTSHHVVNLSSAELEALATLYGKTVAEVQSRLNITVTVSRDVTIPASTLTGSYEMDFAILRLSSSLQGKTPLAIRSSSEVKQTENVYAIGFPDTSALLQSYNTYTSEDATITQGVVNKIATGINLYSGANTNYIQTSCNLDYGNSGGPLVDENGYVIGISQGTVGDDIAEYYNAVAIDQVTEVLNALGIIYTPASAPAQEPVATNPPATNPPATNPPATNPPATLPPLDIPEPEPESNNMGLILIIAAVAVVVIIVVVVVIVAGGKKKQAPVPVAAPVPPVNPVTTPTNNGFAPPPTYPVQSAGETTVLGGGAAGETTVLSRASVNGGTLTRKRTGETVSINTDQFIIGRERKGVNYCIADNSSISRNHVRLTVRGGTTYLTDLNAANGTFVNGVKVMPRQEIALKNGDKITLADEDLEFKN